MSQANLPCPDCDNTLVQIQPGVYRCPNPQCPGGTTHYMCGYCRKPSFSQSLQYCTHASCTTYKLVREACPDCNHFSLVTLHGQQFCMNRQCPSNVGKVSLCDSCGTKSLIHNGKYDVCVKSTCPTLLKPRNFKQDDGREQDSRGQTDADPWNFATPDSPTDGNLPQLPQADSPAPAPPLTPPHPGNAIDQGAVPSPEPASSESRVDRTAVSPPQASQSMPPVRDNEEDVSLEHESPPSQDAILPSGSKHSPMTGGDGQVASEVSAHADANASATAAEVSQTQALSGMAPLARASGHATDDTARSEIEQAYDFVQRTILRDESESLAPLVLVFGLAGSGKSTYLTMLGEVMAHGSGKYHFPYPGVAVRSVPIDDLIDRHLGTQASSQQRSVLLRRVRDLTFDYANAYYNDYLINGAWAPATVREAGGTGPAHSFFLVTEIVHNGATLGRLVTIETSGEDYQEVLRQLGSIRNANELQSSLHRVLWQLLDAATGIIVLLDPEASDNDQRYSGFFRILSEEIEGRAAHALSRLVDNRLSTQIESDDSENPDPHSVSAVLEREEREQQRREQQRAERTAFAQELQEFAQALSQTPSTHDGMASLVSCRKQQLDELEVLISKALPDFAQHSAEVFAKHGRTVQNYRRYYEGIIESLKQVDVFAAALQTRQELQQRRGRLTDQVIASILRERTLQAEIHEAFLKRWQGKPAGRRFERLQNLSLVVTKSDRHPIVYPPSDYPKFKLPTCHPHLTTLEAYLSLLGGGLRCYNATAIGYAVPRGEGYAPGPGNSFTPVNIVEPVFDMLPSLDNEEGA